MNQPTPHPRGDLTAAQALAAAEAISRNLIFGLMPTTGGAVSLTGRRDVDLLYEANQGAADGFAPIVPDTGRPAASRDEWYIAAIEQAVLFEEMPFAADLVADMDALLGEYCGADVDWERIHAHASNRDSTVLPKGGTYWSSDSEPLSVRAFCGAAMRARIADATGALPAPSVKTSEDSAQLADRLAEVEAAHRRLRRAGSALLLGLLALVVVALGTAEHWERVDLPRQPTTFHTEKFDTGTFTVTDNGLTPCHVGQDWTACINDLAHEYNRACTGVSLDFTSERSVCKPYGESIDQMKREDGPGWVVETLGDYGHLTRRPIRETRRVSNRDARPAITHEAVCYLGFIGECPQASD